MYIRYLRFILFKIISPKGLFLILPISNVTKKTHTHTETVVCEEGTILES